MLFDIIMAMLPLGLVGLSSEMFWRAGTLRGEGGRKFIHILSGIWIALWPLFMPMRSIGVTAGLLLVGIIASRIFQVFHAVYDVKRKTLGEYFYPVAIFMVAWLAEMRWQFSLAILLLAVADGMAAVVGTRYEKQTVIYYFGKAKRTVLGTLTYFVCAVAIFLLVGQIYAQAISFPIVLLFSALVTLVENIMPYGSDNLAVPILVVLLLPAVV